MLYDDDLFRSNTQAIFFEESSNLTVDASRITWKRPQELCKTPSLFGDSIPSEPIQGLLGNCWIVAPLYTLVKTKKLKQLFVNFPGFNQPTYHGKLTCRLWDESSGIWVTMTVDDKLPTVDGKLLFGSCSNFSEFWFSLLEKACAKFYGCYEALTSGLASEGFMLFTSGYCWRKELHLQNSNNHLTKRQIEKALKSSKIVVFVCFERSDQKCILAGHYYVITKWTIVDNIEMMKLWNPWNCGYDSVVTMSYADACSLFPTVTFATESLNVLSDNMIPWFKHEIKGRWEVGKTSGGCRTKRSFYKNPQFVLSYKDCSQGNVFICLIQTYKRQFAKRKNLQQAMGLHIWNMNGKAVNKLSDKYLSTNSSNYCLTPSYHIKGNVSLFFTHDNTHQCSIVIPSTLEADVNATFLLRVCTSNESYLKELLPET